MKKGHNQTIQKLFLHKKSWEFTHRALLRRSTFFLCWFIQLYNADMSKFLKGSLSNPLKCWYCQLDTSVNTLVKTARLISSPKSLSVELLVCLPDPINLFRLSSTLAVMFAVPPSEHEILWTAFSVTLAPRFLIAALCWTGYCVQPPDPGGCSYLCLLYCLHFYSKQTFCNLLDTKGH